MPEATVTPELREKARQMFEDALTLANECLTPEEIRAEVEVVLAPGKMGGTGSPPV